MSLFKEGCDEKVVTNNAVYSSILPKYNALKSEQAELLNWKKSVVSVGKKSQQIVRVHYSWW